MGSGCPPASSMSSIAFFPWKVTKNTTSTRNSNSSYTMASTPGSPIFNTEKVSGRGFAPMAIARVSSSGGDFCISFSLQINYMGGSTPQTSKELMSGIALFNSKMDKIYEAGIQCDGYPGSFQTYPQTRVLPINVTLASATTVNLRVGFSNGKVTFYNGESDQLNEQTNIGTIAYVALIMRGEGYYESRFTNVKCSGLTAINSSPTPSPVPENEYIQISNASTDAVPLGSGEVNDVQECKKLCNDTERCTGFDIVPSTNFCTLREILTPLPKNDAYTNDVLPLPGVNLSPNLVDSINDIITELRTAESSILKMKTATRGSWNVANNAYTSIQGIIQTLENIITNNERPTTWNSSFTALINLITDAIQPTDYSVPFGSAAAGWVGLSFTADYDGEIAGLGAQIELDVLIPVLVNLNINLEQTIFPLIPLVGFGPRTVQTIQWPESNIPLMDIDSINKNIVVCNTSRELRIYDVYTLNLISRIFISVNNILYAIFDNENNILCATSANGIQKFTRNVVDSTYSTTSVQVNATNNVTKMVMDESGNFMVTHSSITNGSIQILVRQTNGSYAQDEGINTAMHGLHINPVAISGDTTDITISKNGIICFTLSIGGWINVVLYNATNIYNQATNTVTGFTTRIRTESSSSNYNLIFDYKSELLAYNQRGLNKIFIHTLPNVNTDKYEITLPSEIVHMSFDPTGIYLAVACTDGKLYVLRRQGNRKFIFTKSFNTTLELEYPYSSAYAIERNAFIKFNLKTRDLLISTTSSVTVGLGGGTIKIFKKLTSEEPTRFQSPSPQGADTYLKVDTNIFENVQFRFTIERSDPRGGGLKDVLKSIESEPQSPPATTPPPIPVLNVSTLILDFASDRPEFFIIGEDKQTTYYGTVGYKAITYPTSTETPVLAFSISIDTRGGGYKTFYILTNTIDFQRFTIINDSGYDVFNLPDNQTAAPRRIIDFTSTMTTVTSSISSFNWYRQNILSEISLTEQSTTIQDYIRYDSTTRTLKIRKSGSASDINIPCDMLIGHHKITFKTNSGTTPVSPVVPLGETIAVFFVYDEDTIFLTHTHPSYHSILNIKKTTNSEKVEENIIFTRNNSIDAPFYYKETSLDDPINPYLEIDEIVNKSIIYTQESGTTYIPNAEEFVLYRRTFTTTGTERSSTIFFRDDQYIIVNGNTASPVRYFMYGGMVLFRDKYGTVFLATFTDQTYTRLKVNIRGNYSKTDFMNIFYTLDSRIYTVQNRYYFTPDRLERIKINISNNEIEHGTDISTVAGQSAFTTRIYRTFIRQINNNDIVLGTGDINTSITYNPVNNTIIISRIGSQTSVFSITNPIPLHQPG